MDKEVWCDVKGYEGKYQVSNMGRVKSLNYNRTGKEKLLSPCKDSGGYLFVYLCKEGKRKRYSIHRLVLMTFKPVENMNELQVNHINENKGKNYLSNLEWCDRSYNINHGTRNDRDAEKKSIPIAQLTTDGKFVKAWKSSHEAERIDGFNNSSINSCCKGKLKTHGDYRWCYLSEFMDKHNGIID